MFDAITTAILIVSILAALSCQILLCFKVKSLILRLLPLKLFLILTLLFAYLSFAVQGWDGVTYLLLAFLSAILFGICGICLGVFALVRLIKKRKNRQNTFQ